MQRPVASSRALAEPASLLRLQELVDPLGNGLHIGSALATTINLLSTASAAGGGSGKVIIVAHSMGGLATPVRSS